MYVHGDPIVIVTIILVELIRKRLVIQTEILAKE